MAEPTTSPYAAASAGAVDDIKSANAQPEAAPTQLPATPPNEEPVAAAPPAPPAPPPEELVEIVWNGQTHRVSPADLKMLAQKGFDYTQKTQTLAEMRRDAERQLQVERARYEAEKQEIVAFLKDPQKVQQYARALAHQSGIPDNPDEIMTASQTQRALEAQATALRTQAMQEIERAKAETQAELEQARQKAEFQTEIDRTIADVTTANPILTELYDPEDIAVSLKGDALKQLQVRTAGDPDYVPSAADIRKLLTDAAARRVAKAEGLLQTKQKQAATRVAKLKTDGIEPPGGAPPSMPPPKPMRLGSPELRAAVIADLEAAMRAKH